MTNKSSVFDFIVNNVDIVEIIKNYLNLNKKGQNYWGICPFHSDKNPSMSVSCSKKIFKCFVCNTKGNVIKFVSLFKNINTYEAIKEIKKISGLNSQEIDNYLNSQKNSPEFRVYEINRQAALIYYRTLFNNENKDKLKYLLDRNLNQQLIDEYKIGFALKDEQGKYLFSIMTNENNMMGDNRAADQIWSPNQLMESGLIYLDNNDQYKDFFWNRVIIPIFDENNHIVGFSGRSLNKLEKAKYINTKTTNWFKKENILFNLNTFDKSQFSEIFIVEGYMDVFAFKNMGINNVVATMGVSLTINHIKLIKKYPSIKTIILCFDNDVAGFNATVEAAEKLMKNNFNIFVVKPYDQSIKDIDEYLSIYKKDETFKLINNQISFVNYLVIKKITPDIDKKNKIIETRNILEIINKFAYNNLTINDDLIELSKYSGIGIDELKKTIVMFKDHHSKKPFLFNTYQSNSIVNHSGYVNIYDNEQKYLYKELKLMEIVCCSSFIASLFIKYLGNVYFQQPQMHSVFTLLIIFVRKLITNNYEVNLLNLQSVIENDNYDKSEFHLLLKKFLEKVSLNDYFKSTNESGINQQGIMLIIELSKVVYLKRKKQIIEDGIEVEININVLNKKYNKDLKELRELLENL